MGMTASPSRMVTPLNESKTAKPTRQSVSMKAMAALSLI
jgi:hypothetical protein